MIGSSENTRKLLKQRCRPSGVCFHALGWQIPWPSDSVANMGCGGDWGDERVVSGNELRGDAENGMDELTLTDRITLRHPPDLPFSVYPST